jgi:hypothetical protein
VVSLYNFGVGFSFIVFRNNYPQIHKYFPDGPPLSLKFKMMRSFILIDGEPYYMSPDIEDYFASGKNYEHTEGSVHQTKLEILMTIRKWWNEFCQRNDNDVCSHC